MAQRAAWRTLLSSQPRAARAGFAVLGLMIAGHAVLETARDTLFLTRLPPSRLPLVYLAMAAAALLVVRVPLGLGRGRSRRGAVAAGLVVSALLTAAFWLAVGARGVLSLYALYLWTGLFSSMVVGQLWLLLGEHFTITEARRTYGFIAAGSLVGAAAGAALAGLCVTLLAPRFLLLLAALLFLGAAAGAALLLPAAPRAAAAARRAAAADVRVGPAPRAGRLVRVLRTPYFRQLALLGGLASMAGTGADFLFKSALVGAVEPARLGPAFATASFLQSVLALGAQLLLTGWLLRTVGVTRALLVLPAAMALGAAGVVAGGGVVAAFVLKAADASLRPSLQRTGMELLYLPVEDRVRRELKPLLDVLGPRLGQALAALGLLLAAEVWAGARGVAFVLALVALGWTVVARAVQGGYLDLFRRTLGRGRVRLGTEVPVLDLHALEALLAALNSRDDQVVLTALDVLAASGRSRVIPALILYHPSRQVVLRAFEVLGEQPRRDDLPVMERLLTHPDPEVRAAALRAVAARGGAPEVLEAGLGDPSPFVRATALVGQVERDCIDASDAASVLLAVAQEDSAAAALARAVRARPSSLFVEVLRELARHPRAEVRREAALALREQPDPGALDALVAMLGSARLRAVAREALLTQGTEGLQALERAMGDEALPLEVRRAVPGVLARFPPDAQVARVLAAQLEQAQDGLLRFRALRALGRLRAAGPSLRLDAALLTRFLERTLVSALRYRHWRRSLLESLEECAAPDAEAAPGGSLLAGLLEEKERFAVERAFRTLTLLRPGDDVWRIYRGFFDLDPRVRAGSRELLEALVRPPLRGALLLLVERQAAPEPELEAQAAQYYAARPLPCVPLLEELVTSQSVAVQSLAAYHAAELGLQRFRGQLEALRQSAGRELREVAESALGILERQAQPPPEEAPGEDASWDKEKDPAHAR